MNKIETDRVLQAVARDYLPEGTNLLPGILEQIEKGNRLKMKTGLKLVTAIGLTVLIAGLVLVSFPETANAMRRLLGYLPGVGLVEQAAPLRVLAEPVRAEQNGVVVTVEQAVLDLAQTIVQYQVENLAIAETADEDVCTQLPILRLPDGTELEGTGSGSHWAMGYNRSLSFPAVPAEVDNAMLVFPCLQQSVVGAVPENWELPLQFILPPPTVTVYPLLDLPTPEAAAARSVPLVSADEALSADVISLSLSGLVPLDNGYILYGLLDPLNENVTVDTVGSSNLHLMDSAGQEILLLEENVAEAPTAPEEYSFSLAYLTAGSTNPGPAVFTIESLMATQQVTAGFVFDPGVDPQPGQTWKLDETVEVAGHLLQVASVQLDPAGRGLTFVFDPKSEIQSALLTDVDHPLSGGAGGPGTFGFSYADGIPDGPIVVSVTAITFELAGPWQVNLELPVIVSAAGPEPQSTDVCLTREAWKQAVASAPALPAGLTGKLALASFTEGDYNYQVMVSGLDGSDHQNIGYGNWPSLSPDGSRLVYSDAAGLVLVNLATQESAPIPGTTISDRGAIWSPDGSQIAFTRGPASGLIGAPGPYGIWVVEPEGSNLREISSGNDANHAQAWMPDGERILYTVENPSGSSVRTVNLQTGEVVSLFETNYPYATVVLSPDGNRVAFEEVLPGDRYAVYLADLDGSNRRLLTDPSPVVATLPLWSPDGRWLAVSALDPNSGSFLSDLALIEVDTCQIVPLTGLHGYGYTWIR